ncbi:uncharacterized protein [Maniola hyperantus]|uniref:uncharacterized protein n=1 Tax=Aphantopus hyperantus TaxID=2795564 RepID=UPI00374999AC
MENKVKMVSPRKLGEFDVVSGNWASYCERMEMYFIVGDVKEALRVPTMISMVGDRAYELMVNLCSPVRPGDKTFAELVKIVGEHLQPKPSILAERFRFRQYRQQESTSVSQYVAELKELSRFCDFGNNLSENLRDQLVCGLQSEVIRQRLFAEETLDFNRAVRLATTFEAAEKNALAVEVGIGISRPKSEPGKTGETLREAAASVSGTSSKSLHRFRISACDRCGDQRHGKDDCPYKFFECSRCRRIGHLRRRCPDDPGAGSVGQNAARGYNRSRRGGRSYGMRWGAGAQRRNQGAGIASRGPNTAGTNHWRDEDPAWMESVGSDDVNEEETVYQMSLRDYRPVSIIVLLDEKPLVMEIDTGSALSCISKQTYIERFSELIDGGLGRYTGGRATLHVREGAVPVFCRARPLAYALRERVDAELDAMLRAGVIEPVDTSDWATPLVIVNKPNGAIRVKRLLASSAVLAHYDVNKPVILTCDASALGIGAVLAQRGADIGGGERPVAYASRSLKELYSELGCLMWGHRVIIPVECRDKVLKELHDSHMGIVKTKALARSYVWFPGIDEALEAMCRACEVCAAVADAPPAHAPHMWPWPSRPWTRLHIDCLGPIAGVTYMVVVDSSSKWIEVVKMGSITAKTGVDVDTALCRFLLLYRNTEHSTTGESPAKLLQGRSLRTRLDKLKPEREDIVRSAQARQEFAAGGVERSFEVGSRVWYRNYGTGNKWLNGDVIGRSGSTNYKLRTGDGTEIFRHVDQIKKCSEINSNIGNSINIETGDRPSAAGRSRGAMVAVALSSVPEEGPQESGGETSSWSPGRAAPEPSASQQPELAVVDRAPRESVRKRGPPRRFGIDDLYS